MSMGKMSGPKVAVRLLALAALLTCSTRRASLVMGVSFFGQPDAAEGGPDGQQYMGSFGLGHLGQAEEQQQQPQVQVAGEENLARDSAPNRFTLNEFDIESFSRRQQTKALQQLLDSLGISLATPTYRLSRTFPTVAPAPSNAELGHRARLAQSRALEMAIPEQQQQQLMLVQPIERSQQAFERPQTQQAYGLEQRAGAPAPSKQRRPSVVGIAWKPAQTNKRRPQATNGSGGSGVGGGNSLKGGQQQMHGQRFVTQEVVMNSPMHSHSPNDFETKRVEQSRWDRLKGLWGKRAAANGEPPAHFGGDEEGPAGGGLPSQVAALLEMQQQEAAAADDARQM